MVNFLWPFKVGNDDVFRVSDESKSAIYESIGGVPQYTFEQEYRKYSSNKWRKGVIHTMFPAAFGGALLGLAWGVRESRRGLIRYVNRFKICAHQVAICTGLTVAVSLTHHALVMASDYQEFRWQPMAAGSIGGMVYTMTVQGSMSGAGIMAGFVVGIIYSGACIAISWYQHRHMRSFLLAQQQRETPIHRVEPNMQRMYRAWLYDNRPIEQLDDLRRRALTTMRAEKDVRLDARAYREAMKLEPLWNWISFPEWWPLKMTEKDTLLDQRMRDDNFERRKMGFLDEHGDGKYMLTHVARTEQGRSASGERLWGDKEL